MSLLHRRGNDVVCRLRRQSLRAKRVKPTASCGLFAGAFSSRSVAARRHVAGCLLSEQLCQSPYASPRNCYLLIVTSCRSYPRLCTWAGRVAANHAAALESSELRCPAPGVLKLLLFSTVSPLLKCVSLGTPKPALLVCNCF